MNCIIVDDEFPSREELKYFIEKYSKIQILEEFEEPLEALKFIKGQAVDIIFLDINMPNIDGMTFGKIIDNFEVKPKIVFITAYKEYAIEAFEIKAFDYILKPYSEERIISTLENLQEEAEEEAPVEAEASIIKDKITLWKNEKMKVVSLDEVYYCEAKERDTLVYTKDGSYLGNSKISDLEDRLPSDMFFRTHRSYIVNVYKIVEIIPWFNSTYNLKLKDFDTQIPVSRGNMKKFKEIMGIK